jgi:hypothetical protein
MTDDEYEGLVHDLVTGLVGGTPALLPSDVSGGAKNTIIGASRFAHQIDVSVRAQSFLVLVSASTGRVQFLTRLSSFSHPDLRISETPTRRWRFEPPWFQ